MTPQSFGPVVGSDGPTNAKIMLVGDAPGEADVTRMAPFSGSSGYELDRMLAEAGIHRSTCFVLNTCETPLPSDELTDVLDRRKTSPGPEWVRVNDAWVHPRLLSGLERLKKYITLVQPKVVIAMGNLAAWALTGKWGVDSWRGSTLECLYAPGVIVIPTYPPGLVLRQWNRRIFCVWDMKRARTVVVEGGVKVPDYHFQIRPTIDEAVGWLYSVIKKLEAGPTLLAVDIETRAGHIACVGIGTSRTEAACFPLMAQGRPDYSYWTLEEEVIITKFLREIFTHPNARTIGQNYSYDCQYFWRYMKVVPRLGFDTLLGSHILFPGLEKSLDVLSSFYCDYHVYWKDDGKEWHTKMDEAVLWRYNCVDCVRTYEIAEKLMSLITHSKLVDQCIFLHKTWHMAFDIMVRGVAIDKEQRKALSETLYAEQEKRLEWMTSILGHDFNPASPKQMQDLFYGVFAQKPILDMKTRRPTLGDEALQRIAGREPILAPFIKKLHEYRSLRVFRSTFIEAELDFDQRMRTQYNVAGPETFRFSSSKNPFGSGLNLQNIPKGDEDLDLPNVRKLYIPDPGMEIGDMDLSSADLHIVVWESDEPTFKSLLRSGKDPYTEIARTYYSDPKITKKDPRRQRFKSLAHGTNYGGKPKGLSDRLGLAQADIMRTQGWYFSQFPRIHKWQERTLEQLRTTKTIRNAWGFRRIYFDRVEGTLINQALAWIGQSTVAILINKIWEALISAPTLPNLQMLLQVHDSLVFQYPIEEAEFYRAEIVRVAQTIVVPYPDPLIIPVGLKTSTISWGDCE